MQVFKFGGASVHNAPAIRNMAGIIKNHQEKSLVVVVSAMGKTTNRLENILETRKDPTTSSTHLTALSSYHLEVINDLFENGHPELNKFLADTLNSIEAALQSGVSNDEMYDQVISQGELLSTKIISEYLKNENVPVIWTDARRYIQTDNTFREGNPDWDQTCRKINSLREDLNKNILLTQGFIGATADGRTTTLGREGSDFTAAIFASCLDAESVTVWKDVEGIMNADPKRVPNTVKFAELPYREAAEMTYYGASVIHPKTIKPLANKQIPLYVKSFFAPDNSGTVIHECTVPKPVPAVIIKENQCLVSFHVKDFTFINERNLSLIFHEISDANMKINLMQNSAISFSICVDYHPDHVQEIMNRLKPHFSIRYNTGLELITVKNYNREYLEKFRSMENILLEQVSRNNYRAVIFSDQGAGVPYLTNSGS